MTRQGLLAPANEDAVEWTLGSLRDANELLATSHYLGPIRAGGAALTVVGIRDSEIVAAQVWRRPTSRRLPNDGSFLELSRWCLTPEAGPNAGSRQHRAAVPLLRDYGARTLVSYSDPSVGHDGTLYRAANWIWAPVWTRLRPPPSGGGAWSDGKRQAVKDRWIFHLTRTDPGRAALDLDDFAAVRFWLARARREELLWAERSPYMTRAIATAIGRRTSDPAVTVRERTERGET